LITCRALASGPVEHAHASSPHINVKPALELLSLSPARGPRSSVLNWPEANDMVVSVYDALTADASSSCASTINASRDARKYSLDGSSTQQSHSQVTSSQKSRWQKPSLTSAPRRKLKKTMVDVERTLAAPPPRGGSLSTSNFDRSEWEIMFPLFVMEGLIDLSRCLTGGDV
jgi:hypothetical protein